MDISDVFNKSGTILMEGAIGERLKNEFEIELDDDVAIAAVINNREGRLALEYIYRQYISIAEKYELPLMLMTPTRRANHDRVKKSKFEEDINEENVKFLSELRTCTTAKIFIGGLMGCKGDAYCGLDGLSRDESYRFHRWQAQRLSSDVDYLFAGIMPTLEEAIGMAKAMEETGLPYIISFMLSDDGCLLDGTKLNKAIKCIDNNTKEKPICYMCNCIHPKRVQATLKKAFNRNIVVTNRFLGIQANTSALSPSELDQSGILRSCNPISLADDIEQLKKYMDLKIIGGCCGTNHEHIEEIARRIKLGGVEYVNKRISNTGI